MSAFSVENPHDGKTFENDTRFEWGVEVGVVTTFMLRLFVPHEFDMKLILFIGSIFLQGSSGFVISVVGTTSNLTSGTLYIVIQVLFLRGR